jgi:hypothetical protein
MRYESHGIVDSTAIWLVSTRSVGEDARTNQYQVDDLVHVKFGEERAIKPGKPHGRGDRVLEMTSR